MGERLRRVRFWRGRSLPEERPTVPTAATIAIAAAFGVPPDRLSPRYPEYPKTSLRNGQYRKTVTIPNTYRSASVVERPKRGKNTTFPYSPVFDENGQRVACALSDEWRRWAFEAR